jgi:hypothetical protein
MSWIAAAVVGSAVVGGVASNRAADKQIDASKEAGAIQQAAAEQGVKRIEDSTDQAINTINDGRAISEGLIGDSRNQSITIQNDAFANSNALLREGGQEAIRRIEQARNTALEGFKPFVDAGNSTLPGLQKLINDPNAQKDYVMNNPFFAALADDAQSRIFNNQAAKGRVGSGSTAKALNNELLMMGNSLVSQNISQRFQLAGLGLDATNASANTNMQAGANIANLQYSTNQDMAQNYNNSAANTMNIIDLANSRLTDLNNSTTSGIAGLQSDLGNNTANILTGNAANQSNLRVSAGDAAAAGIVGGANAINGGINNLLTYQAYKNAPRVPVGTTATSVGAPSASITDLYSRTA